MNPSIPKAMKALDTFVNRRDGAMKVVIEPNGPEY